MSDSGNPGFGKFVPGYDFLQNLAKGASGSIPQMPNLGSWVAPTLNVDELDKRISELKGVHFWLEQNARALGATIQALEVQKMTLSTLQGLNFNIADVANALKLKAADSVASGVQRVSERAASTAKTLADVAQGGVKPAPPRKGAKGAAAPTAPAAMVDPLQLWGALTQQFQQIAASALKDASVKSAADVTRNVATGLAKEALKSTAGAASRKTARAATPRKASGIRKKA
ncbi:MAG: PhaM family polyhydroxyalkanoate granule multifunctional regulatory protein [Rhodoferax sp.]